MDAFAFIIHPLDPKADVARKYPLLARLLPARAIHFFSRYWPPLVLSRVTGLRSAATGREVEGWLLACPLTARRMIELPPRVVYQKIVQTGRLAERLGARLIGLGAYTSVVGDGGVTVARQLDIPVTTGDSYTVTLVVQSLLEAARQVGIVAQEACLAVVGASGAIGSVCTELLAGQVGELILVGRDVARLEPLRARTAGKAVELTTDVSAIRRAALILSATSAGGGLIHSEHLRPGAVVCDVARPRDVAPDVRQRDDVLVIDGGLAQVPGSVNFGFDYTLPAGITFGCMAETMALALEGRWEDYTVGKHLEIARVLEIERIAERHGFRLAGLRSFDRLLTPDKLSSVRRGIARIAGSGSA